MHTLINLRNPGPMPKKDIPTTMGLRTLYRTFTLEKGKMRLYIEGLQKDNHHILCKSYRVKGWTKQQILEKYAKWEKGYSTVNEIFQRCYFDVKGLDFDDPLEKQGLMYFDSFVSFSRDLGYSIGFCAEYGNLGNLEVYLMEAYFPLHAQNEVNFLGYNIEHEVGFFYEACPQRIRIHRLKFPLEIPQIIAGSNFYPLNLVRDCQMVYSWG